MDSSHEAKVIRISSIEKHPNADRLEIVKISGYQCVTGKDQFKLGDLAVYIQPDSIVPPLSQFSFVWEKDGGGNLRVLVPEMAIPEKWRRITVRKLRKEWSEGLLMPVSAFPDLEDVDEGSDVAEVLGITHYNPVEPGEEHESVSSRKQSKIWPRSLKGWFYFLSYWLSFGLYDPWGNLGGANEKAPLNTPPIYDVETFKNYPNVFTDGEEVVVTEKIHGSNFRALYQSGKFGGHMYVGSRKLWKRPSSRCIWRTSLKQNLWIERWCLEHPGYCLYGEVVPTQKFKKGGTAHYGAKEGEILVFIFDIRTPEGEWLSYNETVDQVGYLNWVPILYKGPFSDSVKDLSVGKSSLADHIREGVVIRPHSERHVPGLGRAQLKIVSNEYLEQEKE